MNECYTNLYNISFIHHEVMYLAFIKIKLSKSTTGSPQGRIDLATQTGRHRPRNEDTMRDRGRVILTIDAHGEK